MFPFDSLRDGLSSRNGFVRKGARAALAVPKWLRSWNVGHDDLAARPPVLANSFPKSGTHLLVQIIDGLPDRVNYGAFLGSETSSFQLRERTAENTCRFIRHIVPGEVIRGHLYFEPLYAQELSARNAVNYFIYRDPRAVVVSEVHYLREMNRWHRLAPYFRAAPSIEDAITLSITGLVPPVPGIVYPNIAARFGRYQGWLQHEDCLAIRYEDLVSESRSHVIQQMAELYARHCGGQLDIEACVRAMSAAIAPEKSHTFRSGKKSGWRTEFTAEHRRLFDQVAGDLLIELGYERDHSWVEESWAVAE
ncbi:MAG: sulfotransferase domain-containing protein [Planctomycetes bacterium]|nr:sulfotransferase domain-containing protein [Planctomycetota bacterium]